MSCVFTVFGTNFNPDKFLTRSKLEPYVAWRKGEPVYPNTKPRCKKCHLSGFNCEVSRKGFGNLGGQIKDAVVFIKKWRGEILKVTRHPSVEGAYLKFGVWRRNGVVCQGEALPPELIEVAGRVRVGIVLCTYNSSVPARLKHKFRP